MRPLPLKPATFRDSRNLVLARISELGAPLLGLAARLRSAGKPTPPTAWRRGIIMGADHIGDVLYNTASLPALAEALPECEWHFVAAPPATEVLAHNPFVASCVSSLTSLDSVDVALCYNSGGYWRDLVAAVQHKIPNRVAYIHKGFSGLVTHPIRIDYPQPFPAYFRDFVAQLSDQKPGWSLRPKVFPAERDEELAGQLWRQLELDAVRPVLACFVTSRQTRGVWPAVNFATAIRDIERASDVQTVLLGTDDDRPLLMRLTKEFGLRARLAAGQLPLLALVRFLEKCSAVFCTDSGPRHLANAAGVPALYPRNISFSQVEAGRYCETEIDLAPEAEFVSSAEEERVFSLIEPKAVAATVLDVLRGTRRG